MKTICLKEHADFLSTRFLGEVIRREIEGAIESEPVTVVDFRGVSGMSHSFADECFGVLLSENGVDLFRTKIRLSEMSDEVKAVLRFVFSDRVGRQHLA